MAMAGAESEQRLRQGAFTLSGGWKLVRDGYAESDHPGYEQRRPENDQELREAVTLKIIEEALGLADAAHLGDRRTVVAKLADLRDAMVTLIDLTGVTAAEVRQARIDKANRIGKFNRGLLQREVEPQEPQP